MVSLAIGNALNLRVQTFAHTQYVFLPFSGWHKLSPLAGNQILVSAVNYADKMKKDVQNFPCILYRQVQCYSDYSGLTQNTVIPQEQSSLSQQQVTLHRANKPGWATAHEPPSGASCVRRN